MKSENLPSFCLLVGYAGYYALRVPYILFKLEEIKRMRRYLCENILLSCLGAHLLSSLFTSQNQIYWYLNSFSKNYF